MSDLQQGYGSEEPSFEADFTCNEITGLETYTFAGKVMDRLRALGVERTDRPQISADHAGVIPGLRSGDYFDGRLPTVIRRLTLDQLSALYSLFSNWFAYIQYQCNAVAAERSEALRQKEFLWSMVRQQKRVDPETGKKRTDQTMSDLARADSRFVTACARYEELNMLWQCLQGLVTVAEQDMKVISREVTIQQHKLMQEIHESGIRSGAMAPNAAFNRMNNATSKPDQQEAASSNVFETPAKPGGRLRLPFKAVR